MPPDFLSYGFSRGDAFPPRTPPHYFSFLFSESAWRTPCPVIFSGGAMRVVARKLEGIESYPRKCWNLRTLLSAGPLLGRMPLLSAQSRSGPRRDAGRPRADGGLGGGGVSHFGDGHHGAALGPGQRCLRPTTSGTPATPPLAKVLRPRSSASTAECGPAHHGHVPGGRHV